MSDFHSERNPADDLLRARRRFFKHLQQQMSSSRLREGGKAQRERVQNLLNEIDVGDVSVKLQLRAERTGFRIPKALSYHAQVLKNVEASLQGRPPLSFVLDDKILAYDFVAWAREQGHVDIATPRVHQTQVDFPDQPQGPAVVKPVDGAGSSAVYLSFDASKVRRVQDGEDLDSWDEVCEDARSFIRTREKRGLPQNTWMVEELIAPEATMRGDTKDINLYCFYGEIKLVRVITRYPNKRYDFYDSDGSPLKAARVVPEILDQDDRPLSRTPISSEILAIGSALSALVPAPFLRVDLFESDGNLCLGELTPNPGQFDKYSPCWDNYLGISWLRAEQKLLSDLMSGKRFDWFNNETLWDLMPPRYSAQRYAFD